MSSTIRFRDFFFFPHFEIDKFEFAYRFQNGKVERQKGGALISRGVSGGGGNR